MFTGLIEEIGTIKKVENASGVLRFTIAAKEVLSELAVDDSIAINGVCLTVVGFSKSNFLVEAVEETLRKTTLGLLKTGSQVNLERSLRFSDRMGGHFVQGHVDGVAEVTAVKSQAGGQLLAIKLPRRLLKYVISEGSIAINGVSLTVARLKDDEIIISLIPHTLVRTTLNGLQVGEQVNIEVDLIGKYVESILTRPEPNKISRQSLLEAGY
ncbi:MAG: riboflavin synthase [bacterium]